MPDKKTIDYAKGEPFSNELGELMGMFRDQLVIVLLKRLLQAEEGQLVLPVAEVDDTAGVLLTADFDQVARTFTLTLSRKLKG